MLLITGITCVVKSYKFLTKNPKTAVLLLFGGRGEGVQGWGAGRGGGGLGEGWTQPKFPSGHQAKIHASSIFGEKRRDDVLSCPLMGGPRGSLCTAIV